MREIEIKLRVKNLDELEKKLIDAGWKFGEPVVQDDTIYSAGEDSGARWTPAKEGHLAIRIRRQGNVAEFTLKQQKSGEMDNIEYETEVASAQQLHGILGCLGWKPQLKVVKSRKKGKMGDYEICLDKVEGLGEYVEVEKMVGDDADPEKVREELFKIAEPFGLKKEDEEIKGYDTLVLLSGVAG